MKFDPNAFIQSARLIRLRPEEFHAIRGQLKMSVIKTENERLSTMDQQNFLESALHISLRADEKAIIREAIMTDMEATDLLNPRRFHGWIRLFSGSMAAVLLFVACGAGVSYAAESSLPGDALYAVKVRFTEPLLLRMKSSVEAKAIVQARLATRRLEEVERLAEKSQLTTERVAIVHEQLVLHIAALEADLKELAALDKESSTSIGIDTSAEMQAHENILRRIISNKDDSSVEELINTARAARHIAEKAAKTADDEKNFRLTVSTAKKAEQAIKKAKSVRRTATDVMVSDTIHNAEDDLKAAKDIEKATSALSKAKEANLMLKLQEGFFLKTEPTKKVPSDIDTAPPKKEEDKQRVERSAIKSSSIAASVSSSVSVLLSSSISSSTKTSASALSKSSASLSSTAISSSLAVASSTISAQASVSASAAVSTPAVDLLKKTEKVIKKTLP